MLLLPVGIGANQPISDAAHHISFGTIVEQDLCSSVAVGSHTLLSAAHCVLGTSKMVVDNKEETISNLIYDENDHVLIVFNDITFSVVLPIDEREPKMNEHVVMYGFPVISLKAILRQGTFLGEEKFHDQDLYVWSFPTQNGDSGSGYISDEGKVIAVASIGNDERGVSGTFKLQFTPDQLKNIK